VSVITVSRSDPTNKDMIFFIFIFPLVVFFIKKKFLKKLNFKQALIS